MKKSRHDLRRGCVKLTRTHLEGEGELIVTKKQLPLKVIGIHDSITI